MHLGAEVGWRLAMQDRVDDPPIVRCPGCDQPMEAKERTPVTERLVDIR
jgi:hypothetical protein